MTLPILVIGSDRETRRLKAVDLASKISSPIDTYILDTEINAGIDAARIIKENLSKKPFNSKVQTQIIIEAQKLTIEAQNALLKAVEEPFETSQIILTATTDSAVLSTLASRCQKLILNNNFEEIREEKIKAFLKAGFYKRWQKIDSLNFEEWTAFWRKNLRDALLEKRLGKKQLKQIVDYLILIGKLNTIQRKRVSAKIIKTYLLLQAPKIENSI